MAYSKLETGTSTFNKMMNAFGVVTVMNAHVYELDGFDFKGHTAAQIRDHYKNLGEGSTKHLAFIDTLKVAFSDTLEALNAISTYNQEALPKLKETITQFKELADLGEKQISKLENREK